MHIKGGRADTALFEGGAECLVVYEPTSGGVDEEGAWPHLLDGVLID